MLPCPFCGNTQIERKNFFGDILGYGCCGIKCSRLWRWDQVAASLELAKAEIRHAECHPADSKVLRATKKATTKARTRVLEVFK